MKSRTDVVVSQHGLDDDDRAQLARAVALLMAQRRSLVRPIAWIGRRFHVAGRIVAELESGVRSAGRNDRNTLVEAALHAAYSASTIGLDPAARTPDRGRLGRILAIASGSASGFVGAAGLVADLPMTTTLIMRSIAAIARAHGEDITSEDTRRACLEVFAFGSPDAAQQDVEVAYWATRAAFSHASLAMLIRYAAQRFGLVLAQKYLAQAVPIVGAATGGTLNYLFMQHYQRMAHIHFTLRALERRRDPDAVRASFEAMVKAAKAG